MWTLLRRLRAALAILFLPGDRMPVTQSDLRDLRREWAEWEVTFTSLLERLSMWTARQAKREKRALEAATNADASTGSAPTDRRSRKLELSRRLVAGGGLAPPPSTLPPGPTDDGDSP